LVLKSSLYFQVAQKNTSQHSLNAITSFLSDLPSSALHNRKISLNVTSATNVRTGVVSLVVSNIDSLYYCVLPFLDSSTMYTRKAIDYKLWKINLILKIQGYFLLPEGKKLFLKISDILNKRYSTSTINTDETIEEILELSQAIFMKDPPFDIQANIGHIDNVRKWSKASLSWRKPYTSLYICK
jgi:hypothetical protein